MSLCLSALLLIVSYAWCQTEKEQSEKVFRDKARIAYDKGDYDQAIQYLNKILEIRPDALYASNARASAYSKKNGFDNALAEYGNGIEIGHDAITIRYVGDYGKSIDLEYIYLHMKFGLRGTDWELETQRLVNAGGKVYDELDIKLFPAGEVKKIRFDITEPFSILEKEKQ